MLVEIQLQPRPVDRGQKLELPAFVVFRSCLYMITFGNIESFCKKVQNKNKPKNQKIQKSTFVVILTLLFSPICFFSGTLFKLFT